MEILKLFFIIVENKTNKTIMEIINVKLDFFRNEVIGKTFLFADDTSVSVCIDTGEITDMDGMYTLSKSKKEAIKNKTK